MQYNLAILLAKSNQYKGVLGPAPPLQKKPAKKKPILHKEKKSRQKKKNLLQKISQAKKKKKNPAQG